MIGMAPGGEAGATEVDDAAAVAAGRGGAIHAGSGVGHDP